MTQDFLRALWQPPHGYGEIRAIKDGRVHQEFIPLDTPDAYELASNITAEYDRDGFDVYMGVLRRIAKGGKATDCADLAPVLWADIDAYKGADSELVAPAVDAALYGVLKFPLAPSMIVDSGHGIHAYWLLRDSVLVADARQAMKGIAKAIGGDHTHDPARVLRVPGTHNHKGGEAIPVRLLRLDLTKKYRFSDFSDYVDRGSEGRGTPHSWSPTAPAMGLNFPTNSLPSADTGSLPPWLLDLVLNGVPKGQRSEQCFKVMLWLARYGWSDQEIYDAFVGNPQGIGQKMAEMGRDGARWFNHTLEAAREQT